MGDAGVEASHALDGESAIGVGEDSALASAVTREASAEDGEKEHSNAPGKRKKKKKARRRKDVAPAKSGVKRFVQPLSDLTKIYGTPILSPRLLKSDALSRTSGNGKSRARCKAVKRQVAQARIASRKQVDQLDPAYAWENDATAELLVSEEGSRDLSVPAVIEEEPQAAMEPESTAPSETSIEERLASGEGGPGPSPGPRNQQIEKKLSVDEEAINEREHHEIIRVKARVDKLRSRMESLKRAGEDRDMDAATLAEEFRETRAMLEAARAALARARRDAKSRREERRVQLRAAAERKVRSHKAGPPPGPLELFTVSLDGLGEDGALSPEAEQEIQKRAALYSERIRSLAEGEASRMEREEANARLRMGRLSALIKFIDQEMAMETAGGAEPSAPRADSAQASRCEECAEEVCECGAKQGATAAKSKPRAAPSSSKTKPLLGAAWAKNPAASLEANLPRAARKPGLRTSKLLLRPVRAGRKARLAAAQGQGGGP